MIAMRLLDRLSRLFSPLDESYSISTKPKYCSRISRAASFGSMTISNSTPNGICPDILFNCVAVMLGPINFEIFVLSFEGNARGRVGAGNQGNAVCLG